MASSEKIVTTDPSEIGVWLYWDLLCFFLIMLKFSWMFFLSKLFNSTDELE